MTANTRLATATHLLCALAQSDPVGMTSEQLARSLDTNPVVVRLLLKELALRDLVHVRQGKGGGVRLARPADQITMDAVHRVVGGEVFAIRPGGNPRCPVNQTVPGLLAPIFAAADDAVARTLSATTIASLAARIPPRRPQDASERSSK